MINKNSKTETIMNGKRKKIKCINPHFYSQKIVIIMLSIIIINLNARNINKHNSQSTLIILIAREKYTLVACHKQRDTANECTAL